MKNNLIPVLLVVAGEKIHGIKRVITELHDVLGFEDFFVVCPSRDAVIAQRVVTDISVSVNVLNESALFPDFSYESIKHALPVNVLNSGVNNIAGWYYQQFLKMAFSNFIETEYYLIWDADTLPLRNFSFGHGGVHYLTQGNEYHCEYFATINRLFQSDFSSETSHISQHLLVKTKHMRQLISDLERPAMMWWQTVLGNLNGETPFQFSEYETYASYCLKYFPDEYRSIHRPWFRYGNSYTCTSLEMANVNSLVKLYDFVAFEHWDHGVLRAARAHAIVFLQRIKILIARLGTVAR